MPSIKVINIFIKKYNELTTTFPNFIDLYHLEITALQYQKS